jgi:uncharacterized protein (TIGR02594 family)
MPPWLVIARRYLGLRETPGPASNPVIVRWAAALTGWWRTFFTNDGLPWCAVFVNQCLAEAGVGGTGTARAADFERWGVPLHDPALGAIVTFRRPTGRHVGFYLGETAEAIRVFGGNQGDAVSEIWIAKSRMTSMRWPATWALPTTGRVYLAADGAPLSKDEA